MSTENKVYPDSGMLMASKVKKNPKSSDYFGEITIDTKNKTKVIDHGNGVYTFKLGGWKKVSKAGSTFLSLSVDRWVPEGERQAAAQSQQPAAQDFPDEDIPF